ncbi:MAG TPA: DUF2461 domain-containing protein [Bacteroidia bacterium]|jgi:uncharacterized protein (TIGR02453 family)|nr:DUF2461 domain-containing protein [Bacteroidia bacterium]
MISKKTLEFLKKLSKNNNRDWFEKNKQLYLEAKDDVEKNIDVIIAGIRKYDKRIGAEVTAKKSMFRIYRDVRFSKDKSPYKNNIGAIINPGGKKAVAPGYYVHIEPGKAFIAGGLWQPEAPELGKIRQEIDYNLDEFKKIVSAKKFKTLFGGLDQEDKLANVPKGYAKDHPALEFLKLKSFVVVIELKEKDVLGKNFTKLAVDAMKAMLPLNNFLQRAID